MDKKMNVIFISNIGSSFGGNYIESLTELDKTIRNAGDVHIMCLMMRRKNLVG